MPPHVIADTDDSIVGRINLNSVSRGAFQCATGGHWVSLLRNGTGVAMAAVAAIIKIWFTELGLHRIQGELLVHNHAAPPRT